MDGYLTLRAYPDVLSSLTRLKENGIRLAILSNVSPRMLMAAAAQNLRRMARWLTPATV